ncbi:MAG: sigma-70 family RNA polymerase sigma factor [Actinomycetota bacterium]|nr:sigma-70 family RNA polymerase sigma factor [Actinomycetota bacterium]
MRTADRHDRLSDEALLAAVALGERDAVAVFVRRFQRRVYGLAITIVGDRNLAEDVAQQAFERAWRHAGSYDGRRAAVATWLMTITRNLAIDAVRVRRPLPVDPFTAAELLGPAGDDPAGAAVDTDDLSRLRRALRTLPDEQRRAVLLATVGGRTTGEIGEIEGVPVPTAKTRLRMGLRRLRTTMASEVER